MFAIVNNALMEIFMKLQFNPLSYLTLSWNIFPELELLVS